MVIKVREDIFISTSNFTAALLSPSLKQWQQGFYNWHPGVDMQTNKQKTIQLTLPDLEGYMLTGVVHSKHIFPNYKK